MGMIKEKIILFYGGGGAKSLSSLARTHNHKTPGGIFIGGAGRMYYDINYLLKFMIRYHEGGKEWKLSKRAYTERKCYSYINTWECMY